MIIIFLNKYIKIYVKMEFQEVLAKLFLKNSVLVGTEFN